MASIPPQLLNRLRQTLLQRKQFESVRKQTLRAADGRSTPITGAESKVMIENSVTQSSKSNQPDFSSSQTKNNEIELVN